jgi:hypothetical protein
LTSYIYCVYCIKNLIYPGFITINWSFISGGVPTAAERIFNLAEKRPQTPVKTKLVGRDPATGYKGRILLLKEREGGATAARLLFRVISHGRPDSIQKD